MPTLQVAISAREAKKGAAEFQQAAQQVQASATQTAKTVEMLDKSVSKLAGILERSLAQGAKKAGDDAEKLERRLTSLERTLQRTQRLAASLFGGISLGYAARSVFGEIAGFERGLIGVAKTTGIEGASLQELGDDISALSQRIPVAAQKLLEITQAAGQLGVTGSANLLRFTETVARLESATNLGGEAAATTLARVLNVTRESIGDVDRLGSVWVQLGNTFAATEKEIAGVALEVAQATTVFKVSSAEASALGAAYAALGREAEVAGTTTGKTFRAIDEAVRGQGQQLELIAQVTGKSGEEISRIYGEDSVEAFRLFVTGIGRVIDAGGDAAGILARLGLEDERVLKTLLPLASRSDLLAKALSSANTEWERNTALINESSRASESLEAKWQMLKNSVDALSKSTGDAGLLGILKDTVTAANIVINALSGVEEAILDVQAAAMVGVAENFLPWYLRDFFKEKALQPNVRAREELAERRARQAEAKAALEVGREERKLRETLGVPIGPLPLGGARPPNEGASILSKTEQETLDRDRRSQEVAQKRLDAYRDELEIRTILLGLSDQEQKREMKLYELRKLVTSTGADDVDAQIQAFDVQIRKIDEVEKAEEERRKTEAIWSREAEEAIEGRLKAAEEERRRIADFEESRAAEIRQLELELSLVGKTVEERRRLTALFQLEEEARRAGIEGISKQRDELDKLIGKINESTSAEEKNKKALEETKRAMEEMARSRREASEKVLGYLVSQQDFNRELAFEESLFGKNTSERERALKVNELENAARKAGVELGQEEIRAIDRRLQKLQLLRRVTDTADEIGDVFGDTAKQIVLDFDNAGKAIEGLFVGVRDAILEQALVRPLAETSSKLIQQAVGIIGAAVGGYFGGGGGSGVQTKGRVAAGFGGSSSGAFPIGSALGNVFDAGRLVPFALGGILDRPTLFPLAGGRRGLAGEAGMEGIFQIARDSRGRLGVRSVQGERSSERSPRPVTVVVNVRGVKDVDGFRRSRKQIANKIRREVQGLG